MNKVAPEILEHYHPNKSFFHTFDTEDGTVEIEINWEYAFFTAPIKEILNLSKKLEDLGYLRFKTEKDAGQTKESPIGARVPTGNSPHVSPSDIGAY